MKLDFRVSGSDSKIPRNCCGEWDELDEGFSPDSGLPVYIIGWVRPSVKFQEFNPFQNHRVFFRLSVSLSAIFFHLRHFSICWPVKFLAECASAWVEWSQRWFRRFFVTSSGGSLSCPPFSQVYVFVPTLIRLLSGFFVGLFSRVSMYMPSFSPMLLLVAFVDYENTVFHILCFHSAVALKNRIHWRHMKILMCVAHCFPPGWFSRNLQYTRMCYLSVMHHKCVLIRHVFVVRQGFGWLQHHFLLKKFWILPIYTFFDVILLRNRF